MENIVEINYFDKSLKLDDRSLGYGRSFASDGQFDKQLITSLLSLLEKVDNPIMFDVGACGGSYSFITLIRPDITCYSFEPVKQTVEVLKKNIEINNCNDRIHVLNQALSTYTGIAMFQYFPDAPGHSHITNNIDEANQIVEVTTLNDFMIKNGIFGLHVIKIDVEGHEYDVLQGGLYMIKLFHPIIVLEIHGNQSFVREFMKSIGYQEYTIGIWI